MAGRSTLVALTAATDPRKTGATGRQVKPRVQGTTPPESRGGTRT